MTHHELAELLRDHVSHDEPPLPLPHPALTAGRRRLRTRRLSAAGAALAVLAVAGLAVVPRLGGDRGPDTAMDPASAAALEDYDVHRMPELMDEHARRVLTASVPHLGPSRFAAMDSQRQRLPETYWDMASILLVAFGDAEHGYKVTIAHSKAEAEGDPDRYCSNGLEQGLFVDCTVERTGDGDVVISKLWALRPQSPDGTGVGNMVVSRDELDTVPVDQLTFDRTITVIKSETMITYVEEHVRATDHDPASAAFVTPVDDLVAIGTDPELVMPVPPPGANGCPDWTLPAEQGGMDVSCSRTGE
jgi:hypothetical protein